MSPEEARDRLRDLLAGPDAGRALAEAALLIAADEYPKLDVSGYLQRLAEQAEQVAGQSGRRDDAVSRIGALRRVVFEEGGLRGNRDDYYDPRNSYLNEVLDRGLGIPITLAIVVLDVGARLGWPVAGANFPLHFLVRYGDDGPVAAVDAFHGALILGEEELVERWERATGRPAPPVSAMLAPASPAAVLVRLLNNLKQIYAQRGDLREAALAAEKQVLIHPAEPLHHRDLGFLYLHTKRIEAGVDALHRYLHMLPRAPDRDLVLTRIQEAAAGGLRWEES